MRYLEFKSDQCNPDSNISKLIQFQENDLYYDEQSSKKPYKCERGNRRFKTVKHVHRQIFFFT